MDNKYIDLLINNCLNLSSGKSLFIHYSVEVEDFVKKLALRVKEMGVNDIYYDKEDIYLVHDFLKDHDIDSISKSSFFDQGIWDEYAKRHSSFLILDTEYPGVMDDIDEEKIGLSSKMKRESRPVYRKMVEKCELDWCIAAYPGRVWASHVFPDDVHAYDKLRDSIFKCCMLDCDNPSV